MLAEILTFIGRAWCVLVILGCLVMLSGFFGKETDESGNPVEKS